MRRRLRVDVFYMKKAFECFSDCSRTKAGFGCKALQASKVLAPFYIIKTVMDCRPLALPVFNNMSVSKPNQLAAKRVKGL